MSQRIPAGDLSAKLTWIWVGLLLCIFVFWKLRQVWLRHHQPLDKGAKYTQRLARRARSTFEIQALTQFGDAWSRLKPGPLARYLKPERANLKSLADPPFLDIP